MPNSLQKKHAYSSTIFYIIDTRILLLLAYARSAYGSPAHLCARPQAVCAHTIRTIYYNNRVLGVADNASNMYAA